MMKATIIVSLLASVVCGSQIKAPSCVTPGSKVSITFSNDNAKTGDWIGLLPSTTVGTQVPEPRLRNWVWTCGTQSCGSSPDAGIATIASPNFSGATTWVAVLARFDGGTSSSELIVKSATFQVRNDCTVSTRAPTPSPNSIGATIITEKKLYQVEEQIIATYAVGDANAQDWIGIFDAVPINNQKKGYYWLRAGCNRQGAQSTCAARTNGVVSFMDNKLIAWKLSWPLPPGRYVAVLLRGGNDMPPWTVLSSSPVFEVVMPAVGHALIAAVRQEVASLIDADITIASKFLRLGFHDSVGGPDGCVDLRNIHNRGLDVPINALAPIAKKYAGKISRADTWAIAAMVACQVSQPTNADFKVAFEFTEYGRVDCEKQQTVCLNEAGVSNGCSATRGPHREIPGANTRSHDLYAFFKTNYGFGVSQTVAIMGAHTIGVLTRKNSGIDGRNGWVVNKRRLDNEYYTHLIGGNGPNDSMQNLVQDAPEWERAFQDNTDLSDIDDTDLWHAFPVAIPLNRNGGFIVMLNADIAVLRDLNASNMKTETGEVFCKFVDNSDISDPTCPHISGAVREAARYTFSNRAWLVDFESALRTMLNAGYRITSNCIDDLCKLERL